MDELKCLTYLSHINGAEELQSSWIREEKSLVVILVSKIRLKGAIYEQRGSIGASASCFSSVKRQTLETIPKSTTIQLACFSTLIA